MYLETNSKYQVRKILGICHGKISGWSNSKRRYHQKSQILKMIRKYCEILHSIVHVLQERIANQNFFPTWSWWDIYSFTALKAVSPKRWKMINLRNDQKHSTTSPTSLLVSHNDEYVLRKILGIVLSSTKHWFYQQKAVSG